MASSLQAPQVSQRVIETDAPCIVKTKQLMAKRPGAMSLAQGVVHWPPPPEAMQAAATAVLSDPLINSYGPCEGMPALREALRSKIELRNGLRNYEVMVTSGANQAFTNIVLALLDAEDRAVLFAPAYFNHTMALQMTGGGHNIVTGPADPDNLHPDLDWLERELTSPGGGGSSSSNGSRAAGSVKAPKMVVLVNPCNPTGVLLSREELQRASDLCAAAGSWLILDNTYEDFVYDGRQHHCISAPHVINLFSFSKAYGMMGWRVGYIAYPEDADGWLGQQLLKVQDTIPICPTQISQVVALAALQHGGMYVKQQIEALESNRLTIIDALSPLGTLGHGIAGGEGAIYLWARLPPGSPSDEDVQAWLLKEHGVCIIPGTACGTPGYFRVSFANLRPEACRDAAARLKAGLTQLMQQPQVAAAAVASAR